MAGASPSSASLSELTYDDEFEDDADMAEKEDARSVLPLMDVVVSRLGSNRDWVRRAVWMASTALRC